MVFQTDHQIHTFRPDLTIVNQKKNHQNMKFAVPISYKVKQKYNENLDKKQN